MGVAAEHGAAGWIPAGGRGGAGFVRTVPGGPIEELLADYRRYLVCERGLADCTVGDYERVARLFLGWLCESGLGVERLSSGRPLVRSGGTL